MGERFSKNEIEQAGTDTGNPHIGPQCAIERKWHDAFWLHLILLYALVLLCVIVSWRKWPDPVVDFGRELYTPWLLSKGAVLFRDIDGFYGPLSQYFNACLFAIFGPGLMVLVWANLFVYAAIVALLYRLVRHAWSPKAALVALAVFITVFGFGRYTTMGNFNYATPYSHETTHGFLVLLGLIATLRRWLVSQSSVLVFFVGFLGGLTLVLKPEFILASAVVTATAALMARPSSRPRRWRMIALGLLGAALPTLLFTAFFWRHFSLQGACFAAGRAWINVVGTSDYIADPSQLRYSGFDQPWMRFQQHLTATLMALMLLTVIAALGWFTGRLRSRMAFLVAGTIAVFGTTLASQTMPSGLWTEVGRCLLGLVLSYLLFLLWKFIQRGSRRFRDDSILVLRLLMAVSAAMLMARMVLNGRVQQFGYFQAALAATIVVAWLVAELPEIVCKTPAGRLAVVFYALGFIAPGVSRFCAMSIKVYRNVDLPVGEGRDRFFIFRGTEPFLNLTSYLGTRPHGSTLLVLPEGLMVNYLTRMRSPVAPFFFYSSVTERGGEARLVRALAANPPDWVATLPRDLAEYGIKTYGERPGAGQEILNWVGANYRVPASGDPIVIQPGYVQLFERAKSNR